MGFLTPWKKTMSMKLLILPKSNSISYNVMLVSSKPRQLMQGDCIKLKKHGKTHLFMCKECFYVFESSGEYFQHYNANHVTESQHKHKKNMLPKIPDPLPNVENDDRKIHGTDAVYLQQLKQRASGNMDESFMSHGISKKQPFHVVMMVEPKSLNRSRFKQELIATILFTIAFGMMWFMAQSALSKYVGGLGGMGPSSVSSSFSYSPKDLNKEVMPEKNVKTFKDVKGCDDAKQELEEVVEYLRNPTKFTRLGGKLPKGILLTGAPGTGKTLLAKAIAGEAGVPFFYRAGSEFEEMFVGVGARRVRSLFQAAKKKAPCIIFIDEIDAVGSTRKQWEGHTKKTLHQLLVEMDGFEQNEGIILMAATNLPDILDPALTRPGRFNRHIIVSNPDVRGRQEILELYLQEKPLADDIDIKAIARGTPGFNGADPANLVNIAATKAAVEGVEQLTATQFEFAKDRIMMGTERQTMFQSEESKKLTVYHESGHAIVAFNTEAAYPIHKATILPRGSALGMVTQLPSDDQTSIGKKQLLASRDVCMGGRFAEELIFGKEHVTTGASDDLKAATKLANSMVSTYGMSDVIGSVYMKEQPGSEMQSRVDAEVEKHLREAYVRVKALLKKATIMPRGSALGMVTQLPSNNETLVRKKQLLPRLDVCMGGRVAEELIVGQEHVTSGASSDLKKTTDLAQNMVAAQLDHFLAELGKKEVNQLPKLFNEDPTVMEWRTAIVGKTFSLLECG